MNTAFDEYTTRPIPVIEVKGQGLTHDDAAQKLRTVELTRQRSESLSQATDQQWKSATQLKELARVLRRQKAVL